MKEPSAEPVRPDYETSSTSESSEVGIYILKELT